MTLLHLCIMYFNHIHLFCPIPTPTDSHLFPAVPLLLPVFLFVCFCELVSFTRVACRRMVSFLSSYATKENVSLPDVDRSLGGVEPHDASHFCKY